MVASKFDHAAKVQDPKSQFPEYYQKFCLKVINVAIYSHQNFLKVKNILVIFSKKIRLKKFVLPRHHFVQHFSATFFGIIFDNFLGNTFRQHFLATLFGNIFGNIFGNNFWQHFWATFLGNMLFQAFFPPCHFEYLGLGFGVRVRVRVFVGLDFERRTT